MCRLFSWYRFPSNSKPWTCFPLHAVHVCRSGLALLCLGTRLPGTGLTFHRDVLATASHQLMQVG